MPNPSESLMNDPEVPAPSHRLAITSHLEDLYSTLLQQPKSSVPLEIDIDVPENSHILTVESASADSAPDKRHGRQQVFYIEANLQRVGNFRRNDAEKIRDRLRKLGLRTNDPEDSRLVCWLQDSDHMGAIRVEPQSGTNVLSLRTRRKPTHEKRIYPYLGSYEDFNSRLTTFQLIASYAISALPAPKR